MFKHNYVICATALVLAIQSSPTWAQIVDEPGRILSVDNTPLSPSERYGFDYFEPFQPQTAADMVSRLPGFQIRGGEGGERGFGQASLNVLINGRRPSSKSSDANEILSRIPADNVKYIEILDGASIDIPGLSGRVANIVAIQGDISGSWRYAARFEEGTEPQIAEGTLNVSGSRGRLGFVGSLNAGQFTFTDNGTEQFFDGNGTVVEDRIEDINYDTERPSANINLTWTRENDDVGNLNLSLAKLNTQTRLFENSTRIAEGGVTGASFIADGEDELNYEIGADYTTAFDFIGDTGSLKFIGLHRFEDSRFTTRFLSDDYDLNTRSTAEFLRKEIETEYIGRTEYTFKTGTARDWTASFEGAFNVLDATSSVAFDSGPRADDAVRVEELRGQLNLTQSWAVTDALNVQTSLGAEYSELDVASNPEPASTFFRPKGFISASYAFNPMYNVQAEFERSVGQLNFNDFVSTVSLNEGTAKEGNDNIVPEQVWAARLTLQRQNAAGVSGSLIAFYDRIEDPIDRVLFADGTQGPGNLETAEFWGLEANATWVADAFVPGLRVSAEGAVYGSAIEDPVTGFARNLSNQSQWAYEIDIRYDIPKSNWAFEAEVEQGRNADNFLIDERRNSLFTGPEAEFSIIHKDVFGMEFQVVFQNLAFYKFERDRLIFSAPMGSEIATRLGPLRRSESVRRDRGQRVGFILSDTF